MELPKFVVYILRVVFITVNNLYCIPTQLVWLLILQPLRYLQPSLYWYIEGVIYKWLLTMVGYWGWMCGHRIIEYGDDVSKYLDKETLLLVNHQSTCDVPALFYSLLDKRTVVNNQLWIIDKLFKWSNFGWISQCHRDFFIAQGKNGRGDQLKALSDHIINHYWPLKRKWITLFPEGGFLYKRRPGSQKYARERNLPVLEHVTLPRVGCLHTILNLLSPNLETRNGPTDQKITDSTHPPLKYIVNLTLAYPKGKALNFADFALGTAPPCDFAFHYRCYPASEVPTDTEELTKWIYDRFVEKEAILDAYYKTGKFPALPPGHEQNRVLENPRQVILDERWIFFLHLLYMFSTAIHIAMFKYIFSFIF